MYFVCQKLTGFNCTCISTYFKFKILKKNYKAAFQLFSQQNVYNVLQKRDVHEYTI